MPTIAVLVVAPFKSPYPHQTRSKLGPVRLRFRPAEQGAARTLLQRDKACIQHLGVWMLLYVWLEQGIAFHDMNAKRELCGAIAHRHRSAQGIGHFTGVQPHLSDLEVSALP